MTLLHHALLVLSLSAAVSYGLNNRTPPSVSRMIKKTSAIGILSILSITLHAPLLLVAAQSFGAIGDSFLAWEGAEAFLCGLGSFLIAHLFYIALFVQSGGGIEALLSENWRVFSASLMMALAVGMLTKLLPARKVKRDGLQIPILVYSMAICAMVLAALTMDGSRLIFGAIMFTFSDTLLAIERFLLPPISRNRAWMEHTVWALYYLGQLLIMVGLLDFL